MPGEPIKLITKDKSNRLEINVKALEKIKKINDVFGVCVCVGPYRQGKSYLMSRLIGELPNGFQIGHSDNACTKGITMWSEAVKFQTPNGVKNLLILDTEGLESDESNSEWDNKLFLASLVLSSMFIYNTKNALTSDAFKKLATIASFHDKVSTTLKASAFDQTRGFRNEYGPTFTWVVRDFSLANSLTPRQKLDNFLNPENFDENDELDPKENEKIRIEIKSRNQIRENMLNTFKEINCYYLPVPVVDGTDGLEYEEALAKMETLPPAKLRPVFEKKLNEFIQSLRDNFELKKIKDKEMNGPVFVEFIKQIVDNINKNAKIYLLDNLNLSFKLVANDILETAKNKYESKMENLELPLKSNKYTECENFVYKRCIRLLESSVDANFLNDIKNKFDEFVNGENGAKKYYFDLNEKATDKKNTQIIETKWNQSMKTKIENPSDNFKTSSDLMKETNAFKSDIISELFEYKNFDKLWKQFISKINLQKVIEKLDQLEKERKELFELEEAKRQKELKELQELEEARRQKELKELQELEEARRQKELKEKENQEMREMLARLQNENHKLILQNQRTQLYSQIRQNSLDDSINDSISSISSVSSYNSIGTPTGIPYHVKLDGTPDMRYKENRMNLNSPDGIRLKKDGTPDMRYKANRAHLIKYS